jgi:integrase
VRANYIEDALLDKITSRMTHHNAMAIKVARITGLRISDVLGISTLQVISSMGWIRVREKKTGKTRRIYISRTLKYELLDICGRIYIWEHRYYNDRPRTRQAVWKDLKRACKAIGVDPQRISPHSVRKTWAVKQFEKLGDLEKLQKKMLHTKQSITMYYAMADKLVERRKRNGATKSRPETQKRKLKKILNG